MKLNGEDDNGVLNVLAAHHRGLIKAAKKGLKIQQLASTTTGVGDFNSPILICCGNTILAVARFGFGGDEPGIICCFDSKRKGKDPATGRYEESYDAKKHEILPGNVVVLFSGYEKYLETMRSFLIEYVTPNATPMSVAQMVRDHTLQVLEIKQKPKLESIVLGFNAETNVHEILKISMDGTLEENAIDGVVAGSASRKLTKESLFGHQMRYAEAKARVIKIVNEAIETSPSCGPPRWTLEFHGPTMTGPTQLGENEYLSEDSNQN